MSLPTEPPCPSPASRDTILPPPSTTENLPETTASAASVVDPEVEFPITDEFPIDVFPKFIREQCVSLGMRDNIATAMPAMGFLGGGAAAIGRGLEIGLPDDDRRIASCLWITPVARPATGKSSMMEPLKVLVAVYKEEEAAWRASYNETQAKIKTLFGEAKAQEGKNWNLFKKKIRRLLT